MASAKRLRRLHVLLHFGSKGPSARPVERATNLYIRLNQSYITVHEYSDHFRPRLEFAVRYPFMRSVLGEMRHRFRTTQWLPYTVESVFAFFANPANLPKLHPDWQQARIDEIELYPASRNGSASPEPTIAAGRGTRVTLSFRPTPLSPVRLSWVALIEDFHWNDRYLRPPDSTDPSVTGDSAIACRPGSPRAQANMARCSSTRSNMNFPSAGSGIGQSLRSAPDARKRLSASPSPR